MSKDLAFLTVLISQLHLLILDQFKGVIFPYIFPSPESQAYCGSACYHIRLILTQNPFLICYVTSFRPLVFLIISLGLPVVPLQTKLLNHGFHILPDEVAWGTLKRASLLLLLCCISPFIIWSNASFFSLTYWKQKR